MSGGAHRLDGRQAVAVRESEIEEYRVEALRFQRATGALDGDHPLQGHRRGRQLTADKRPVLVVIIDEKHVE